MPPPLSTSLFFEDPLVIEVNTISKCLKELPKWTLCGRDGLQAQKILDALYGEGSTIAQYLLCAISLVVNLWIRGICPMSLVESIASTHLMSLLKLGGGICLISIGFIWKRLISKIVMKWVRKDVTQ